MYEIHRNKQKSYKQTDAQIKAHKSTDKCTKHIETHINSYKQSQTG